MVARTAFIPPTNFLSEPPSHLFSSSETMIFTPHLSLFFDCRIDPILRLPKTRFRDLTPSDTLNLSTGISYQKPLKDFLSRSAHLLGDHVTRISFAGNKKASAAHIFKVIDQCSHTKYLDLTATALKAEDFEDKQFRDIQELTVGNLDIATTTAMIKACSYLESLNICDDNQLDRLDLFNMLSTYPNIKHVMFKNSEISEHLAWFKTEFETVNFTN